MARLNVLLHEGVVVQGVMAVIVSLVCGYLFVTGQLVPPELMRVWWFVLGYYFGSLGRTTAVHAARQAIYQITRGGES